MVDYTTYAMTHKNVNLERIAVPDDTSFKGRSGWGQKIPLKLEIKVHPNKSGVIIVNYPGYNGDIDGYNNKYQTLADFLQQQNVGAVVRSGNYLWKGFEYPISVQEDLRCIIDYAIKHSREICGSDRPRVGLMGFSAGSSAIAAIASSYDLVDRILLIAPSRDAGEKAVKTGLGKFKGEVYIAVGENDEIVGKGAGKKFYDMATNAKVRKLVVVPNCDHQFRGETNGRIMSKAPLWAFAGDTMFPSPQGGIKLYS